MKFITGKDAYDRFKDVVLPLNILGDLRKVGGELHRDGVSTSHASYLEFCVASIS